jgi:uncharacterized protein (DUF1015 family)
MPEIQPFGGILYQGAPLERVLAPPYDVISKLQRDELYDRHPKNIVRVILNREPGDAGYALAGQCFRDWRQDGTLRADTAPALYALEQSFEWKVAHCGASGCWRACAPRIPPAARSCRTSRRARARARTAGGVLQETRANFSPIFMMVPDSGARLSDALGAGLEGTPAARYTDDGGVAHRLFRITDAAQIASLQALLQATKAYIADGHHRYATALRYRDAKGPEGAWTLGYFTPMDAPGLLVLPYHRILAGGPSRDEARRALGGKFLLNDVKDAAAAARDAGQSTMPYAFALAWPEGGALVAEALPEVEDLFPPDTPASLRALDTQFVHAVVLPKLLGIGDEDVSYVHSFAEAQQALSDQACRLALLMRGTPVRQIVDVAEARQSMPAKATFFHPKLPSGLVIHPLAV